MRERKRKAGTRRGVARGKRRSRCRRRSSLREDLDEETEHLGHVELYVLEVEKVLVVFLL